MSDQPTCGSTWDMYPAIPGKLVKTCSREPHSTRAWHRDGDTAWKDAPKKKRKKAA